MTGTALATVEDTPGFWTFVGRSRLPSLEPWAVDLARALYRMMHGARSGGRTILCVQADVVLGEGETAVEMHVRVW